MDGGVSDRMKSSCKVMGMTTCSKPQDRTMSNPDSDKKSFKKSLLNTSFSIWPQISQMGKVTIWVNQQHSWLICQERRTKQSKHHDSRVKINYKFPKFLFVFNLGVLWICHGNVVAILGCITRIFMRPESLRIASNAEEPATRPLRRAGIIPDPTTTILWNYNKFFYSGIHGQFFYCMVKNLLPILVPVMVKGWHMKLLLSEHQKLNELPPLVLFLHWL